MEVLGLFALIVSVAIWLFNPKPVRQWIGLEPRDPYFVSQAGFDVLRADPRTAPILERFEERDLVWPRDHEVPGMLHAGYTLARTTKKEPIHCRRARDTLVLVVKPLGQ